MGFTTIDISYILKDKFRLCFEPGKNKMRMLQTCYDYNIIKASNPGPTPELDARRLEILGFNKSETEKLESEAKKIKELSDKPIERDYPEYM